MSDESTYTVLARRYRPLTFDEVVGQEHVSASLKGAIAAKRVGHAYLFCGPRGVGKTSMAHLFAKALNCVNGPTDNPCKTCEICVAVHEGTDTDIIEMDAASNRSVDDVRDLRERVAYAPTGGRWKVYILDEAHMLTKEAWNAFLKTLEEPPPNTVFVLATTEAHKVMATIADRCQRFDFQRPSLEQISEVLTRVAAAEAIEIEDAAVATIARSASGSFRDALGTLDQLVAYTTVGGKGTVGGAGKLGVDISLDQVLELLGAADAELLFEAVDAVVAEDPKAVLLGVERMARSGRDPAQFARDLLAHLRHLIVTQTVGEVPNTFVVTATDSERLQAQASSIGPATLVRTIDELATALTNVREGDDARMAVEIALLKAARPDLDPSTENLLRRIERLEQQGTSGSRPAGPVAAGDPPPPPVAEASSGAVPPTAPPAAEAVGDAAATGPAGQSPPDLETVKRMWPAVLDKLRETSPALAATFEGARPVGLEEGGLKVGFPAEFTFNKKKAETPDKRELMADAIESVLGERLRPTYELLDGEATPDDEAPVEEEIDHDALVEKLKSELDAEEVG